MIAILAGFTLSSASLCLADFSAGDAGTSTAQFLKIGVGARAIGMGEAQAGLSNDVNAVYWNPAGLSQLEGKEVSFMHCIWLEQINYQHLAYAHPTKTGVFGGAINYLSMDAIEKIDNTGSALNETFSPTDVAITLSYARKLWDIPFGANLKYISSTIDDASADAVAIDLGVMYKLMSDKLSLGFVLQNAGTSMKFNYEEDTLPMNIKIGSAYMLNSLVLALDINAPTDNEIRVNFGIEYVRNLSENFKLSPRIGYKTNTKGIDDSLAGLSIGLGFCYNIYSLDYAWVPYGDLGQTNRVSLSAKF